MPINGNGNFETTVGFTSNSITNTTKVIMPIICKELIMIAWFRSRMLLLIFIQLFINVTSAVFTQEIQHPTIDPRNPYPNMEIFNYGDSHAYVFKNNASDKLLINIDGSGWDSVLGIKNEGMWTNVHLGAHLLQYFGDKYTILIPEKLKRQPGLIYYTDMEDRANYTADKLLNCYSESINGYLSEYSFASITIVGAFEGSYLVPLLYERLINKEKVKSIVSIFCGGLSLYESYSILNRLETIPIAYRQMYRYFLDVYRPGNYRPDSYLENVYELTYRWYNSFIDIRPFDYYKHINIPVLFIAGYLGSNVPDDSFRYLRENLPEKPFDYIYKNPAAIMTNSDFLNIIDDIVKWLNKTNQ